MTVCLVLGLLLACAADAEAPGPAVIGSTTRATAALRDAPAPPGAVPVVPAGPRATGAAADRWLAEDKVQHFAASFAATVMAYGGARFVVDPGPARAAAAGVAVLLGVGKEALDAGRGGPFSFKDLAWDVAGVALGYTFVQRIR